MSPRPLHPFRVLQLVCVFLLLHHSNLQASMVSGAVHLQSSTRVLQHKSGLLGDEVTMCERTLNTDYTANLTECASKPWTQFPGHDDLSICKRKYSELSCQTEIACQHCDNSLQDWLTKTQTSMNSIIRDFCHDSSGQFHPFMCPITAAPTTKPTTTIPTTHNSTTRAPFPKWAIYTLASGVIIVIVLVILILWYGLTRFHPHTSSHHHESDSKQSLKSTRTHKSSSSRGSQAKHNGKSIKYYPPIIIGGRPTPSYFLAARAKLKKIEEEEAAKKAAAGKKATSPAASTHKKASSGKVASRGKVTTSSARRTEAKQQQQQHHGPKMVNPRAHSTGNVKKGH